MRYIDIVSVKHQATDLYIVTLGSLRIYIDDAPLIDLLGLPYCPFDVFAQGDLYI